MKKYKIETFKYKDLKSIITVPRFQRSPVWSEKKKKNLIETIKRGLPIGSVLLSKNRNKFDLIDGLQRISTLKDFEINKFKYVDENEIQENDILKIISSDKTCESYKYATQLTNVGKEKLHNDIKFAIINCTNNVCNDNLNDLSWKITDEIQDKTILSKYNPRKIQNEVSIIINRINDILAVDEIEIPAIVFENDGNKNSNELVEIFTKLNSEGVKLSKYDIFSATWQDNEIVIPTKDEIGSDIIDSVIKKYEISSEKSGLEITDFDADLLKREGIINLFEYAYSIAKVLSNRSSYIVDVSDQSKVDSFGFTLLAGVFKISNNNMVELGDYTDIINNNSIEIIQALSSSINAIENTLKNWVICADGTKFLCHSELQLASYVLVYFHLKYEFENKKLKPKKSQKNQLYTFKAYLHKHYIYDILRGYWSGSGDSKLYELITSTDTCRYLMDVDKNQFETIIIDWLSEQNAKLGKVNIQSEVKLFLNYIHRGTVLSTKLQGRKLHFDHIVAKELIKTNFTKKSINVPISTPCNLVLVSDYDNTSTREYTYYQVGDFRGSNLNIDEDILTKIGYPSQEELRFTQSLDEFTKENYQEFLSKRKDYLVRQIVGIMY